MTAIAELVAHRDLIRELVVRALKVRYRRSAIGFLWTMLHPLIMMLVLSLVFSQVFRFEVAELRALCARRASSSGSSSARP